MPAVHNYRGLAMTCRIFDVICETLGVVRRSGYQDGRSRKSRPACTTGAKRRCLARKGWKSLSPDLLSNDQNLNGKATERDRKGTAIPSPYPTNSNMPLYAKARPQGGSERKRDRHEIRPLLAAQIASRQLHGSCRCFRLSSSTLGHDTS